MIDPERLQVRLHLARKGFSLGVDLSLPMQGITVLFGPSGSGKTTLLRCIAGLDEAKGFVSLGTEQWLDSDKRFFKPSWKREIGYVFQEASLFEHFNVVENLRYGLKRARGVKTGRDLDEAVALLGIEHLLDRNVQGLSGGERQRIAIARALATRPRLLLLDEPLASLDMARRSEVLPWLERIHESLQMPVIYVTHSMDELCRLADFMVFLDQGSVTSSGPVQTVMLSPRVSVAMGDEAGVIGEAEVIERLSDMHLACLRFGSEKLWVRDQSIGVGRRVRVRILAKDVSLTKTAQKDTTIQNHLQGVIESISAFAHPSQALVRIRCNPEILLATVTHRAIQMLELSVGSHVWCQVKSVALIV